MKQKAINKLLISNILFRFRNMNIFDQAHMIALALENPDYVKATYPEVFKHLNE